MKKKFMAGLCACALALAMPMGAMADPSPEYSDLDLAQDGNKVSFEDTYLEDVLSKIVIEGAENVTVTEAPYMNDGTYDEDAWDEYWDLCYGAWEDGGEWLFCFEVNGDITDDKAVLTFHLNEDEYGGKTIVYYILHDTPDADGNYIQKKVVNVDPDGTVTIFMDRFSIVTFLDVEGIEKYENMVEPQDGALLSPKTGC